MSVAWNYDWIFWLLDAIFISALIYIPLHPKRKGIGQRDYDHSKYVDESQEYEENLHEEYIKARTKAKDKYLDAKTKGACGCQDCYFLADDGRAWCCQRWKICVPWNHLAWFRWVYSLALGVCFSIQIKYYFDLFGPGEVGHRTDNQVWLSLIFGTIIASIFVRVSWLQDIGFGLGAWLTIIIWVLKTWAPDLQLGVTITVIAMTGLAAMLALGFCLFWAFCAAGWCLTCCCSNSIGHLLAILLTRVQMYLVTAFALTWCIMIPNDGIGKFEEADTTWMVRCIWVAAVIFTFIVFVHEVLCRRGSACYRSWEDPELHTVGHAIFEVSGGYGNAASGPPVALTSIDTDDPFAEEVGHAYPVSAHDTDELSLEDDEDENGMERVVCSIEDMLRRAGDDE